MLVVENITKTFPGVVALNNVCMDIEAAKVTAIIGENGAGKSTLMKILSGIYHDYQGSIIFKGQRIKFSNPKEAQEKGIAIIHQELNLIPHLTVTENLFLGREIVNSWGMLDKKAMRSKTISLLEKLKVRIDPNAPISDLKVGQQQLVEIAKALLVESDVIIMDEPTSAISEAEVEVLFGIINGLIKDGKAVVYISHKLDELFKIADRFIVLRDGNVIESGDMKGMTHQTIIQKMVGREINIIRNKATRANKDELLKVEDLCLRHPEREKENFLQNISFTISRGEIAGIFGLMGAGRTELLETIFGMHPNRNSGNIFVDGKKINCKNPGQAIRAGLALVPEDRKRDGLILELDVKTNISLTTLDSMERAGVIVDKKEKLLAKKYVESLQIKTPSERQLTRNLSGGNQQKVVLAKWLSTHPRVLMLDEPTRGIDIKAKGEIYQLILKLASEGLGIILVSSELPEIIAICDRVLVMAEGKLTAEVSMSEATEDKILHAAIPKSK